MSDLLNTEKLEPLLTPKELFCEYPLFEKERHFIANARNIIQSILSGEDKRFLIILGPCSIHNIHAAKEYASKLKKLASKVHSHIFLAMRVYVEKPRTTLGWKGLLHDPYLNGSHDMNAGLRCARNLLVDLVKEEVPCSMEFLELMSANYLADLVSWGCIGARTAASQPHRQIASLLPMPVGFKNGVDGNLHVAVEGALAAKSKHAFMNINEDGRISQVHSKGNLHSHIVLRGGGGRTNFDPYAIAYAVSLLRDSGLPEKLLIDCAHGNSHKKHSLQQKAFQSVLKQISLGNDSIAGAMLESNLYAGSQEHKSGKEPHPAISLTDPCIDWEETEELVMRAYDTLLSHTQVKHGPDLAYSLLQ
ncbi:MAG: 3-deoxy-7-phosphoheptulonate synthase [Chlamydiales bacterium]|nr:3-deoxy-7-phosphoheptulonate synthase [Chlamydiales bacterium]